MQRTFTPREMIAALVGIPTVSRDSNMALIEFVAAYLAEHGVRAELVASDCGEKANLYATIGPNVAGGVVLSGHTDVVPIDEQNWSSDPFELVERNGKLFGRGTCDMKSFYAIALALVPQMHQLRYPIHFALSYDEEIGCLGAPRLIEQIAKRLPTPRAVIVGEPTGMRVVTAHKSILHFETRVTGVEAHSSQPHRGVSAVMAAGQLINWLGEKQHANAQSADAECEFQPPYTTLHCGVVKGGTAANIMARHCRFVTDVRALPDEDPMDYFAQYQAYAKDVVEACMRTVHPDASICFDIHANVPGFKAPQSCSAVEFTKRLTGQNRTESQPYGSEAGQFQQAGFPVVMCGPGSIDQAHQPDEYITLQQVEAAQEFTRRLIEHLTQI